MLLHLLIEGVTLLQVPKFPKTLECTICLYRKLANLGILSIIQFNLIKAAYYYIKQRSEQNQLSELEKYIKSAQNKSNIPAIRKVSL